MNWWNIYIRWNIFFNVVSIAVSQFWSSTIYLPSNSLWRLTQPPTSSCSRSLCHCPPDATVSDRELYLSCQISSDLEKVSNASFYSRCFNKKWPYPIKVIFQQAIQRKLLRISVFNLHLLLLQQKFQEYWWDQLWIGEIYIFGETSFST